MIIQFIQEYISFPKQYEFLLYLGAMVILTILLIITLDFFISLFMAIFKRK